MIFHSRKKDYHQSLIQKLMLTSYYNINSGICFGIASMGLQAFLLRDTVSFDKRISELHSLTPDKFQRKLAEIHAKCKGIEEDIKKELLYVHDSQEYATQFNNALQKKLGKLGWPEKSLLSTTAFFDGILVYQIPYLYGHLFPHTTKPLNQDFLMSAALVLPQALENQGGIETISSFCGAYTIEELENNLMSLQKIINEQQANFPVGMMLGNHNHALSIGFDPKYKKWMLIEADNGPTEWMNEKELAHRINQIFSKNNITLINTDIYTTGTNSEAAKKIILAWKKSDAFIKSHAITPARAKIKDSSEVTLLFIATQNNYPEMVRELIKNGAEINIHSKECPSPLCVASCMGNIQLVQELLSHGAVVNQVTSWSSPLIMAAKRRNVEVVRLLLDNGGYLMEIIRDKELIKLLHEYREKLKTESPIMS